MKKMKAISLFSGAGGMDLGFRRAGVDIVWANDFNAAACETYRLNFGDEIQCGSLMDFDYEKLPDCELIFGGPPCQGFSIAGKMDPDDPRSKLVFEFQKVVAAKHPAFFVMENVAALAKLEKFAPVRARLLAGYRDLGYSVEFRVLDSQNYSVPQRRERLIMIGTTCGREYIRFPRERKKIVTAREVLSNFDEPGVGKNLGMCDARITLAKKPVLRASPYAGMLFNGLGRPIDLDRPCQTLPASMGGNKTPIVDARLLADAAAEDWLAKIHAKAMRGKDVSRTAVPAFMRRITVSEAAALQGFPSGFEFCGSRCERYRQIGNSVPPPLAEAVGRSVVRSFAVWRNKQSKTNRSECRCPSRA